jgi:hypothetical protein
MEKINAPKTYWYFTNLSRLFQEDANKFARYWDMVSACEFSEENLVEILKQIGRFLGSQGPGTELSPNQKAARAHILQNFAIWENKIFEQLKQNNAPSLYALNTIGDNTSRLGAEFSLPFIKFWQQKYFEHLKKRSLRLNFVVGMNCLKHHKNTHGLKAAINKKQEILLLSAIEACIDNFDSLALVNTIHGLQKLDLLPGKDLQKQLTSRMATLLKNQASDELVSKSYVRNNHIGAWPISQFIFSSGDLTMIWPKELFVPLTELANKHVYDSGNSARSLLGLAALYNITHEKSYKDLATTIYEKIDQTKLGDEQKRQVFDSCKIFGLDCNIARPAETNDRSEFEKKLKKFFRQARIPIAEAQHISQGTGHHFDIALVRKNSDRQVLVEPCGPTHFKTYLDHKNPETSHHILGGLGLVQQKINSQEEPDAVIIICPHLTTGALINNGQVPKIIISCLKEIAKKAQDPSRKPGAYIHTQQANDDAFLQPLATPDREDTTNILALP